MKAEGGPPWKAGGKRPKAALGRRSGGWRHNEAGIVTQAERPAGEGALPAQLNERDIARRSAFYLSDR